MSCKVYISSTYEDLKDLRAETVEAILKHEMQPIGMEYYTVSEKRPVDKCLLDVRKCDIYVGVIAFRYGFVPNGYEKSITRLEYEEAGRIGIPRLLFLISENAKWEPKWIDKDRSLIDAFRNHVLNEHLSRPLDDPKELKHEVFAALQHARRLTESTPHKERMIGRVSPAEFDFRFPPLLPYLSDRSLQRDELRQMLSEGSIQNLHRRPLVTFVHGHEHECHDEFLQKVRGVILPELMGLHKRQDSIALKRIDWPAYVANPTSRLALYRRNLARAVAHIDSPESDLIVQGLNTFRKPVLLYSETMTQDWNSHKEAFIEHWLDFWNTLPDLVEGKRLIVFLCVKHSAGSALSRFGWRPGNPEKRARRFLKKIDFSSRAHMMGLVLSELSAIGRGDLNDWIHTFVEQYCDDDNLKIEVRRELAEKISGFYRERNAEKVCMADLVKKLNLLLDELKIKYPLRA